MYSVEIHEEAMRPRERLVNLGAENLSNQELLAILLRTGTRQHHVLTLANNILEETGSLADFRSLSLEELQAIPGIGRVKSIELKAALEFAKRVNQTLPEKSERIISSDRLAKKMMAELRDKRQEHLIALYLDTQNRLIKQLMATSVSVVHNHPSGQPDPSRYDIAFTEKIKRCCDDLGLAFLDHIIVGSDNYYSFREETDIIIDIPV